VRDFIIFLFGAIFASLVFVVRRFRLFAVWLLQLDYRGIFIVVHLQVLFGSVLLGLFVVLRVK